MNRYEFYSPIGCIAVEDNAKAVTAILLLKDKRAENSGEPSYLGLLAKRELDEYFRGERYSFDLPLLINGTEFQKLVWTELLKIPYGELRTYKDIAERIGKPKACRAVGSANNKNSLPIVIPCHRVVGVGGKLVGFSDGLEIKEFLIKLEKNFKKSIDKNLNMRYNIEAVR